MGQFRVPENASAIEDLVLSMGTYGDANALELRLWLRMWKPCAFLL